jgi:hypothetical protein
MSTTEVCNLEIRNAYEILSKHIYSPSKTTDINKILKDFKVNLQDVREYEKRTNKKLIKFGINHDNRYKPFYQSVLDLKEEHYFVYGLLAQIFRQNLRINEKGELLLGYMSFETFQKCLERNYQEEMEFIKINTYDIYDSYDTYEISSFDFPATYESLYLAYLLLEESFVERYCFLYQYCLHRS